MQNTLHPQDMSSGQGRSEVVPDYPPYNTHQKPLADGKAPSLSSPSSAIIGPASGTTNFSFWLNLGAKTPLDALVINSCWFLRAPDSSPKNWWI